MATQKQQAAQGFKDKQVLRAQLEKKLKAFNKRLMQDLVASLGNNRAITQAFEFEEELAEILQTHYEKVGGEFSTRIAPQLPEDIEITDIEKEELLAFLLLLFGTRSKDQAEIITGTNQRNINKAIKQARDDQALIGGETDNRTIALVAGAVLARLLAGRSFNVSFFETQSIAELSKDAEARILAGLPLGGPPDTRDRSGVTKKWIVRERKRSDPPSPHLAANGQERDLNQAFLVNGVLVRWPTDMELGAVIGEESFCWCSSQLNIASLIRKRRTSSIGRS